ncbi:solute carrier organic anion transporter family member 2B1-like isoform X1 [Ostrea edulis]|uniref:solute carrier organic anion transporter family member 2B1-like isoform X1 n=1 Tax=Ostrea edulis TaxID=37623 RepID=UPI0024AEC694|nr:solute carrier organic anion transporter family member 2B1-like isoform X1 [Ostrea edulis]
MKSNGFHLEVREKNTECGIGRFRPRFLRHFANINTFVGVYSAISMVSQILTIYVNTQVPNLERQFGLSSTQSGLVMGFNDIGFFAVVLFVSAAARYVHIPRMLFVCILLYGFSGLICSIPHFVAVSRGLLPSLNLNSASMNTSTETSTITLLCKPELNLTDNVCEIDTDDSKNVLAAPSYSIKALALSLIGVGMTLQGIGKAPRGPFYLVYIDDNIERRKTGFYTSIAIATSIFGPALAFGVGGYFSKIYVTLEGSLTSYSRILRNPAYLLTNAMSVFNIMSVGGWFGFSSKFLMTHFNIPLSLANYILACANIGAIATGSFLGGLLTRKITMTPRNTYRMIAFFYVISMTFLGLAMLMSCPQPTVVGPKLAVPGYIDVTSQNCSLDCSCRDEDFYPICGSNKVNYHSPCFAGCQELLRNGRIFTNCSCIPDGRANAGLCENVCPNLTPWVIFIFLSSITASMKITPTLIAIIRSVEDKDKASALGLNSCLAAGLGWALSPIIFGKMLDGTCYIWQFPCSSSGACELYDLRLFRLSIHGLSLAIRCLPLLCLLCLMIITRKWEDWKFSNKNQLLKKESDMEYTKVPSEDVKTHSEQQNTVDD